MTRADPTSLSPTDYGAGIYKANQPLDVQECTAAADAAHKQAKAKLHGA